jgi:6-phosphogluconate dehydrogenase
MQIAVLGLPLMGRLIADKLLADGHEVVVWSNIREPLEQIRTEKAEFVVNQKLTIVHAIEELRNIIRKPRVFWLMQDPGEPTESLLIQLSNMLEAGDVIIDGANANFRDSDRHFEEYEKRGVKFLGIGIAGGINALENGCCLMIGGNADAYQYLTPVFESLAKPNAIHTFLGRGGAGHFVKMVHDGVEMGMSQAVAEGIALLNKSQYQLDPGEAAYTWQEGGIVSSFILDMALDVLGRDPTLSQYDGDVKLQSQAGNVVDTARENNLQIPAIAQSVDFQKRSQYDRAVQETIAAKAVQAMREEWEGAEEPSASEIAENVPNTNQ